MIPAMTVRELVEKICELKGWEKRARTSMSAWMIEIPQPRGRKQDMVVTGFKDGASPMVRFTTVVGSQEKLDATRVRTALELNSKLPHGCLALEEGNLILTGTRPLDTTTPATSAAAIAFLAGQADMYERLIYGADEN